MATYKFEQFNSVIKDPVVIVNGQVGTTVHNNIPQNETYADVMLQTDNAEFGVRLTDNSTPRDWSMESINTWVNDQLKKYEVE